MALVDTPAGEEQPVGQRQEPEERILEVPEAERIQRERIPVELPSEEQVLLA